MNKLINKKELKTLYVNNVVFNVLKDELKNEILKKLGDEEINLNIVADDRVGTEFLKYVIKTKKVDITKYLEDFEAFLKIVAILNGRANITQSDLLLLLFFNMNLLGIEDWTLAIESSVNETMFRELNIYLDSNGDLKDELTTKFEEHKLSSKDKEDATKVVKWLELKIKEMEDNRANVLKGPQLQNIFMQDMINNYFNTTVDNLLRKMKFQRLGFKVAIES